MSDKEIYKAICAECGKDFEVPFNPDASSQFIVKNATRKHVRQDQQIQDDTNRRFTH